ncbi:MAG: sigma-70 family RNA polymerase sigma factor [Thermoguttaceae bacterium]
MTHIRVVVDALFRKILRAAETIPLATRMTTSNQRSKTDASAGTTAIDWQAALAAHERWLRVVVCARLGEPQAIDEVMQDVAVAAVRQRAPLTDASKVAPWLYQLAVRQALLYRRKQGRRRKLIDRYATRFQPSETDVRQAEPLDWLLSEERRRLVCDAMRRLPGRDAEILMLKYNENWSYRALAERLGISHSAVEARLHRARGRLREQLAALDVTPTGV